HHHVAEGARHATAKERRHVRRGEAAVGLLTQRPLGGESAKGSPERIRVRAGLARELVRGLRAVYETLRDAERDRDGDELEDAEAVQERERPLARVGAHVRRVAAFRRRGAGAASAPPFT